MELNSNDTNDNATAGITHDQMLTKTKNLLLRKSAQETRKVAATRGTIWATTASMTDVLNPTRMRLSRDIPRSPKPNQIGVPTAPGNETHNQTHNGLIM